MLLMQDPSLSEALFYLHVLTVAASDSVHEVAAATPGLQDALKHMVAALGEAALPPQQQIYNAAGDMRGYGLLAGLSACCLLATSFRWCTL
jgi:hypothetical protein